MSGLVLNALALLAVGAVSMNSSAQLTYKCGNSYSQTPCPDAVLVDTEDRRTSAQKLQTDQATQRDARVADAMERARLQQEAKDLAANTPAPKASHPASTSKNKAIQTTKTKKKAPKTIVLKVPQETEKKKETLKKATSEKKDAAKS
jgi:hypothetical protein